MADTDQQKKIRELEVQVTKLEENLRKAHNNMRELDETMTQMTIRSERAMRDMIQRFVVLLFRCTISFLVNNWHHNCTVSTRI